MISSILLHEIQFYNGHHFWLVIQGFRPPRRVEAAPKLSAPEETVSY